MSRRLEVLLHGQTIGYLTEQSDLGTELRFLSEYLRMAARPVLGQKFEDDLERAYRSRKGKRLPDFFANLIPEGRLREVIQATAELEVDDDLGLLAHVGQDLPGAVVIRPRNGEWTPSGEEPEEDTRRDSETTESLRFSLAGVQLKFSMLRGSEKLTLPGRNRHGEWIVKFDSPTYPNLPENELSILEWARQAGFDVPECHLHPAEDVEGFPRRFASEGTRVLAVRRYDRSPAGRVHQEDLAQAVGLPPEMKYDHVTCEAMARLVRNFIGEDGVDELVRRIVLVIAAGNNDAHLKNWSLIYPDTIQGRWSPVYDQVATIAWKGPSRELSLKLAGVKRFDRIDHAAFDRFASKSGLDPARVRQLVDGTIDRLHRAWKEIAADLPMPGEHFAALQEHWRSVPLLRNSGLS